VADRDSAEGAGGGAKARVRRSRRARPPWGGILGGKLIERKSWYLGKENGLGEEHVRKMQYFKMLRLKQYYQIKGGDDDYPIIGLG
jgi:hypothetical protein